MTHELKIHKQWADAKLAGEKPFEIRRNDRGFQKGDLVRYKVVDPKTGERWYGTRSGPENADTPGYHIIPEMAGSRIPHPLEKLSFRITYVIEGKEGLERGFCVFADMPDTAD